MRTIEPARKKFKRVCEDLTNLAILTKSATPGEVQQTFVHAFISNKLLGESVTDFSLAGLLEIPTVVSIDTSIAFVNNGDNIRITVTKVLLHTEARDLSISKKQR